MAYYRGVREKKGEIVPEKEAYQYMKDHLDELDENDRESFVIAFFSGNEWIKEDDDDEFGF